MARVERYVGQRLVVGTKDGKTIYEPKGPTINMPAVAWSDGSPWLAATVYLRRKAFEIDAMGGSQKTVAVHATALAAYGSFLEDEALPWNCFPEDKSLRPTYRYRGWALKRCDAKELARSTAANHMSVLRAFYAWAFYHRAVSADQAAPYIPRKIAVRYSDSVGLQHSKIVLSSDLAIKRPSVARRGVEEGCAPLRMTDRDNVLRICKEHFRIEFSLAIKLGFFCGLRFGTICGLTHQCLRAHFPSPDIPGWRTISVGPQYGIPTKGNVNYYPSMPEPLLLELLAYCTSVRRGRRERKAKDGDRDLVFISSKGNQLTNRSFSADMTALRRIAEMEGLHIPWFHFHCTRATFGTAFVLASLKAGHTSNDIYPRLMRLLGHTNAASSKHYIDFVEDDQRMEKDATAYTEFLQLPAEVTA